VGKRFILLRAVNFSGKRRFRKRKRTQREF